MKGKRRERVELEDVKLQICLDKDFDPEVWSASYWSAGDFGRVDLKHSVDGIHRDTFSFEGDYLKEVLARLVMDSDAWEVVGADDTCVGELWNQRIRRDDFEMDAEALEEYERQRNTLEVTLEYADEPEDVPTGGVDESTEDGPLTETENTLPAKTNRNDAIAATLYLLSAGGFFALSFAVASAGMAFTAVTIGVIAGLRGETLIKRFLRGD